MSNSSLPSGYAEGSLWYYAPSNIAPVIFAVLFLVSGTWHVYQIICFKSWRATGFIPIGAVIVIAGYVLREVAAFHYDNYALYVTTNTLLLFSPPVYEAANCFLLGQILYYVPYQAPIHPLRFMITFASLSGIFEVLNANGASRATQPKTVGTFQTGGTTLLQISLVLQIFNMLCFIAMALRFEYNCRRADVFPSKLRSALRVVYVSCALIAVRTIYRSVEWFEAETIDPTDPTSFPLVWRHEAFFYVFEAGVMLINSFLLNVFHPTRFLPSNYKVYLAPDGVTEVEGKGLGRDPRPKWQQLLDPFDFYGLFTRADEKNNIWEQQPEASTKASSNGAREDEKPGWGNWQIDDELVKAV